MSQHKQRREARAFHWLAKSGGYHIEERWPGVWVVYDTHNESVAEGDTPLDAVEIAMGRAPREDTGEPTGSESQICRHTESEDQADLSDSSGICASCGGITEQVRPGKYTCRACEGISFLRGHWGTYSNGETAKKPQAE